MLTRWIRKLRQQQERIETAKAEAERSRQRLAENRRDVVDPISRRAASNQFVNLIKQSLIEGR